jgi:hypothetical protein
VGWLYAIRFRQIAGSVAIIPPTSREVIAALASSFAQDVFLHEMLQ